MNEAEVIEQVENVLDAAAEAVVPEVFETVEVVRNNPFILAGVAIAAASIGSFIGYRVAERRLSTKFDKLMEEEIEKTKDHYAAFTKTEAFATPEQAAEKLLGEEVSEKEEIPEHVQRLLDKYNGEAMAVSETTETVVVQTKALTSNHDDDEVEVVHRNIFVDGKALQDKDFDFDEEVRNRSDEKPYIITEDEYMENDSEYPQRAYTYYAGDRVLCDEEDRSVDDVDRQVGLENLGRFGHGARASHIVFIRNDRLGVEFEIDRSPNKFSVEVLGLDDTSAPTRPRKFRGGDE